MNKVTIDTPGPTIILESGDSIDYLTEKALDLWTKVQRNIKPTLVAGGFGFQAERPMEIDSGGEHGEPDFSSTTEAL